MDTKILTTKVYSPITGRHYTLGIWVAGDNIRLTLSGPVVRKGYICYSTIPVTDRECEQLKINLGRAIEKALDRVEIED